MKSRHAPARTRGWFRVTGWLALALLLQQPAGALAQAAAGEHRLQGGDAITLSVPSRPELDQTLTLDAAGRVSLPQVGDVVLQGLTVSEAREILRQRLRVFYPGISGVDVELQSATQVRLYALGEVHASGHYDFPTVPSIWDLLRAAGGPSEGANLGAARIVRMADGKTRVIPIDLSGMLSGSGAPEVQLQDGDTLVIPASSDNASSVAASAGVQVFGAVGAPTVVAVSEPTELLQVMMLAGSPLTTSDLSKVYWVHRGPDGFLSTKVNVRQFMEEGDPRGNPLIYPGDTVQVSEARETWLARRLPLFLGILATAATVALAYDRIANY